MYIIEIYGYLRLSIHGDFRILQLKRFQHGLGTTMDDRDRWETERGMSPANPAGQSFPDSSRGRSRKHIQDIS